MDKSNIRKEQAESTRQKLLDSARQLFAENGYKGTSVRSINRRLNLADGLLYHYFPGGKKEIFQTIVTQNFRKVAEEIQEKQYEDRRDIPLEKILEDAFSEFTSTVEENIDIIRIILKENNVAEFISKENIMATVSCNKKRISDFLKARSDMGEIGVFDFESAADAVLAGLVNYILIKSMELPSSEFSTERAKKIIKYNVDLWKKKGT
ncbi:MAG: TetR/AcrR family transcriptional regulator [Firmicutes bacterium]|nr:TetR/AcrR family transcriptional regulator [[Eubacterium] siraeum]MCM1488549.1 TetR/AcrR family transcriptional regulator [Bacillota bacterium]